MHHMLFTKILRSKMSLLFSARSKVKGHLQLYHAYIPDPNEATENSEASPSPLLVTEPQQSQEPEPGWEMVDSTDSSSNAGRAQVEQPARVCKIVDLL